MRFDLLFMDLKKQFDAPVEIAFHPVRRRKENARAGVVVEKKYPRMFQEPAHNALDVDVLAQVLDPGDKRANPRTMRRTLTPAFEASYNFSMTRGSSSEFILAMMSPFLFFYGTGSPCR